MSKAPKQEYSKESLDNAIQELQNNINHLSERQIASKYGVPRSSLRHYVKNPGHKTSIGPAPILSQCEENELEDWLLISAKKGFPKNKNDVLDSVQKFLKDHPRTNPFPDDRPGEGWWKAFLKRHPKLSIRTSEGVTKASACVSEKDIRGWFKEIENYITENGLSPILSQPHRIFNADETGFQLCSSTGQVLALKGSKNVYNVEQSNSKEAITVLFTFSAAGENCCPFVVFPYQRLPEKNSQSIPDGWGIGRSDNGWMTKETFYEYIANVFHPFLVSKGIELPVILFVDGHKTHLNFHLSQLCSHLQIELIALYPNATRILQPADVAAFRPLKVGWRKFLHKWQNENQNRGVTKQTFAPLLNEAIAASIRPEILINGFRACGLYPFNPDAIDYTKCLGKSVATTDSNKEVSESTVLTYYDFSNIVGHDLISSFKNRDQNLPQQNLTPPMDILFKLWQRFHTNQTRSSAVTHENKAINTDWAIDTDDTGKKIVVPKLVQTLDKEHILYQVDVNSQTETGQEEINTLSPLIIPSNISTTISSDHTPTKICLGNIDKFLEMSSNTLKHTLTTTANEPNQKPTTDLDYKTPLKVSDSYYNIQEKQVHPKNPCETAVNSSIAACSSFKTLPTPSKMIYPDFRTPIKGGPNIAIPVPAVLTHITHTPPKYTVSALKTTSTSDVSIDKSALQLPSPKILKRKCSFGEYLAYPETPVRKGKRQTERTPFAISSKPFKEAVGKKMIGKENAAKEKEKKRTMKEEKKNSKEKLMATKRSKSNVKVKEQKEETVTSKNIELPISIENERLIKENNETSTNGKVEVYNKELTATTSEDRDIVTCEKSLKKFPESKKIKVLNEVIVHGAETCAVCCRKMSKFELICNVCSKNFHIRCIPRKHKDHIPDKSDINLFLCHICYQVDDSDSGDSDSIALALLEDFNNAKKKLY